MTELLIGFIIGAAGIAAYFLFFRKAAEAKGQVLAAEIEREYDGTKPASRVVDPTPPPANEPDNAA